jgi:hypothetical protein
MMTITEAARHRMHDSFISQHGEEVAAVIMEHLPPLGWSDVARSSDVGALRFDMDREFLVLRTDMNREFAAVRSEMAAEFVAVRSEMAAEFVAVRSEMAAEFVAVRSEMAAGFAAVRSEMAVGFAELRAEMHKENVKLMKFMILTLGTMQAIGIGSLLAGMKFL